jgi:Uma2 family endonuclease
VNVSKPVKMTADEFIAWGLQQDSGRYELEKGELITMAPEKARHVRAKAQLWRMLDEALAAAGLIGEALMDGISVQIEPGTVYEPDALVRLGSPINDDETRVADPVIVVEVLSPSTAKRDLATKLVGYFRLPSVRHYLVFDPDESMLIHHARRADGSIATATLSAGVLRLEPPGLVLDIGGLFGRLESGTQDEPLRTRRPRSADR